MRAVIAIPSARWRHVGVVVATVRALSRYVTGCGPRTDTTGTYGAASARVGESLAELGWNISVTNLRLGLYGTLAHPIEASGIGGCAGVATGPAPLSAPAVLRTTGG